jgi:membrane-associated phospholipid phosphatase
MRMPVLWGIIPTFVVVLVGVVLVARPALVPAAVRAVRRRTTWGARLTTARAQLKETLGPAGAWVMLCGAGLAVSVAVLWPLGRLALRLEDAWDRPVFEWFSDHRAGAGWNRLNEILTQMGNRPPIYVAAVAAALVLVVFAPRRRWAPPALVIMAVLIEQFVRVGLLRVVDRGHPPTSEGTWPSGGVGRTIAIYGFIVFLLFWCARRRGLRFATGPAGTGRQVGRAAVAAGAIIAVMATVEGYTRIYLQMHWITDVLGGYVFGCLLLAVFVYAGRALLDVDAADNTDAAGAAAAGDEGPAGTAPPDDVMSARR